MPAAARLHTHVCPPFCAVVGCLGKCKSSILSGLPQAKPLQKQALAIHIPKSKFEAKIEMGTRPVQEGNTQDQRCRQRGRLQSLLIPALAVVFILCVLASFIPGLDGPNSGRTAREATALGNLHRLVGLQNRFSAAHPEKGFTCQLSLLKSTTPSAGDYDPERFLVFDRYAGYRIKLDGCDPDPKGLVTHYRATAVPVEPGKSGVRAFCTDQSGALWYDNGGSADNCLATRRSLE
jgi:hypothetical protein